MRAWPPKWAGSFAPERAKFPTGEEGTLTAVRKVERGISPPEEPHLVLTCEYLGRCFSANLELDDLEFLNVVYAALQNCKGKPLDEVGTCELHDK
jgi:hypothetical protein